jgi:hypothetical protein
MAMVYGIDADHRSQLCSVAFTACAWYTTTYLGVDRHTWDVPVTSFPDAAMVRVYRLNYMIDD